MTREQAQEVATQTVGHDRYLNGHDGAYYWSAYKDEDERDGGPEGAATYATPLSALAALTMNIGMVVWPAGWEVDEDPQPVTPSQEVP